MKRRLYSYVFQSASYDYYHIISEKDYKDVYDFMRNEVPEEYDAWKDDWDESEYGPWNEEEGIDYGYYDKKGIELNGINGPLKEIEV